MSGYVPRHSRFEEEPAENPQQKNAPALETAGSLPGEDEIARSQPRLEQDSSVQEETLATQSQPPVTKKTPAKTQDKKAKPKEKPATEQSQESDEVLFDETPDADKAKREHPDLSNTFIETDGTAEPEVDPTLVKTRKRKWPIIIAIILAVIIIGGAITYYVLYTQAMERENDRTIGYGLLDESIALIQESDQFVVTLDAAIVTEVTENNLAEREVLLERVPVTLETLQGAEEKAIEAVELFSSAEDKEFGQHVVEAAANRIVMLTNGEFVLTKDIEAMTATQLFGQTFDLIVDADTAFRESSELSNTGGYYELQEAIESNDSTIATLAKATELLTQAQEAFAEADFSSVTLYLRVKTESVLLAIEADQAMLDGDADALHEKNVEFGLKDAAVVNAANLIPADPLSLITNAYDEVTAEARALYDSARANAAEADAFIREYVGVETQTGVQ